MTDPKPQLLNHLGEPISSISSVEKVPSEEGLIKHFASYLRALHNLDAPPIYRSKDPLSNHAWVYVAAMIRALNFAQPSVYVHRETDEQLDLRRRVAKKDGRVFTPKYGRRRMAIQRHLRAKSRMSGMKSKLLEPDFDHEFSPIISKPNPLMSQSILFQILSLWLSLRGEAFWLLVNDDGKPVQPGEFPDQIWPANPDQLDPRFEGKRMVGWWLRVNERDPYNLHAGARIPLAFSEVVQFKYANPFDPYRGLSPIMAAASGIDTDVLADANNRATIINGSDPGGILMYEGDMEGEEEDEAIRKWEDRHNGPRKKNRTAIMQGAWKYMPTGISPKDMEFLESKRWNRETIFSILRVPKSVAGITDDLNYATQLGQDKNLWEKSLLPDWALVEDTLDMTLFYEEGDDRVIAADLSTIAALREGLDQQIDSALKLMGTPSHMDPRTAFMTVGLDDIPRYEGDEVALVSGAVFTLDDVLNPPEIPEPEPVIPEDSSSEEDEEDAGTDEPKRLRSGSVRKASKSTLWNNFIKFQTTHEKIMRRGWRKWVAAEKALQLAEVDRILGKSTKASVADIVLLPVDDLRERLGNTFRPLYAGALESTLENFESENGIATFNLDDPNIVRALERRKKILVGSAPETLQKNLRESILEGIQGNESVEAIRQRVATIYDIHAGSSKALQVARTESAGFMNDAREEMFQAQGITTLEWVTAGDEVVRDSHKFFGKVGPQEAGTNYLGLDGYPGGGSGVLTHPGDHRASAGEVINCRCIKVAAI